MEFREMTIDDIESVLPFYISYYNDQEGCCWTKETARKRIHQVLSMEDSYSLLLEENGSVLGFAMGYFKQYDDVVGYTLEEIIIKYEYQNKELGSVLLRELESRIKSKSGACIELQAVNDDLHERFYGKNGFHNAKNFIMKVKWFE